MTSWPATALRALAAMGTAILVAACGGVDDHPPAPGSMAQQASPRGFTVLAAAAQKAGPASALDAPTADLTVFAPSDAALDALARTLGSASASAMVQTLDGPTLGADLGIAAGTAWRACLPRTWWRATA